MTDSADPIRSYVREALLVQGYKFSESRIEEIVKQFARIESIARTIAGGTAADGGEDLGTAPVFRP